MDIIISDLSFIYNVKGVKNHVLQNISSTIKSNSFVAIMGKSGMGKSTLLKCIAGLLELSTGSIIVDNFEIAGANDDEISKYRKQTIGIVFQDHNLLDYLTVFENVELPMVLMNEEKEIREQRVNNLLNQMGIIQYKNRLPDALSLGEKQRVAICVALANDPAIILADEPTGSLDLENSKMIYKYFKEINEKDQKTILMVTHDHNAREYVDEVLLLKRTSLERE
ncbi:MAG: ABC transporter ATP-binding protein [Candidatus Heimdallarchaeota archaeon]|nr:ABC transporter ATP-binding protein [Candidatus Heimdallarchaeota archaeon]